MTVGVYIGSVCPVQTTVSSIGATVTEGRTMILKVAVSPVQLTLFAVNLAATFMLAVTGTFGVLVFAEIKEAMLPVPEGANPIAVLSLIHPNDVAAGVEAKFIEPDALLLQMIKSVGWIIAGRGFTVISMDEE